MSENENPPPDPYTSLCSQCTHSMIEESEIRHHGTKISQIILHCLKINQVIWWAPDHLFGPTDAPCRLPTRCTRFFEKGPGSEFDPSAPI
ncbi:MAG: hypothetical protein B7Z59_07650 [Acidiphilium sp. 37-67-22]|nr:MAG: hypothetical protein B7Z59_07650 [Acidiphilium sp. 37-67-22]